MIGVIIVMIVTVREKANFDVRTASETRGGIFYLNPETMKFGLIEIINLTT